MKSLQRSGNVLPTTQYNQMSVHLKMMVKMAVKIIQMRVLISRITSVIMVRCLRRLMQEQVFLTTTYSGTHFEELKPSFLFFWKWERIVQPKSDKNTWRPLPWWSLFANCLHLACTFLRWIKSSLSYWTVHNPPLTYAHHFISSTNVLV